jgi:class 3 adenylate cyclase
MTFEELLNETVALLQRQSRLSYRALKRQFDVDDQCIEDLKIEIVDVLQLAVDQDGKILVWTGPRPEASPAEPAPPPPAVEPARAEAERRQLTVMFCDLVDSTALAVQLDPEDLREVLRAYQETASTVVQRFGGHIAQYLGDGILVYFGYPVAHDDDAMRAIRTGLETVEAMEALNTRLATRERVPLAIRVGIHTGPVVVGEVGTDTRYEHLAMGETPNVAARVQGLAPPNGVVVTATTWRLAQGFFVGESLGAQSLKGVVQPIALYRVLGESGARSRLEAAAPGGFTPLVGRDSETRLLIERWSQSRERMGQAVLFSGEAGVGKLRLVDVLGDHVRSEGGVVISFRCSPYRTNSALYPVIDHLQRLVDFRRTETAETKVAKLEVALAGYRSLGDRAVPLLAVLLSVPLPEDRRALPLSPQQVKDQTMETLTAWLIEESERQPVLAVFEDLHWADPSTLELLGLLIDELPTARVLMVLTFRQDFRPPWTSRSYFTHLTLNRFTRAQTEAMIAAVTRGTVLPAEVVQQVVAKTDGVPLFIEELLNMIIESGLLREEEGRYELRGPLPRLAIPTTLQDSLMARLDRIATAREIAQIGATVGREFSYEMVSAVSTMTSDVLERGLAQLAEAELVYARAVAAGRRVAPARPHRVGPLGLLPHGWADQHRVGDGRAPSRPNTTERLIPANWRR